MCATVPDVKVVIVKKFFTGLVFLSSNYTVHSTFYHQNTFLLESYIQKIGRKQTLFHKDEE